MVFIKSININLLRFIMPFEEKRAYRRFNLVLPAEYKFASFQNASTQSSILDVSANGLRLQVNDKPLMEDEVHITLDLPDGKKIKLAATIVWAKTAENGKYEIGVRLANTKSEDGKAFMDFYSQQLLSFIESNKKQGQGRIVQ